MHVLDVKNSVQTFIVFPLCVWLKPIKSVKYVTWTLNPIKSNKITVDNARFNINNISTQGIFINK